MDLYLGASGYLMSIIWIAQTLAYSQYEPVDHIEVCQLEHRTLECHPGQVILVLSARYGRMRANRCIGAGHLGCATDVLGWLDRWCSGRSKCYIDEGLQVQLENINYECPQYRVKYLELSYTCVDVTLPTTSMCSSIQMPAAILHEASGYISSHVTREASCFRSPWVLTAPPNNTILIEVVDFSWALNGPPCDRIYAEVFDVRTEATTTICRRNHRKHGPYLFVTSKVLIRILPMPQGTEFLLRYSVIPSGSVRTGRQFSAGSHVAVSAVYILITGVFCVINGLYISVY